MLALGAPAEQKAAAKAGRTGAAAIAPAKLELLPAQVTLVGPRATQRFLAEATFAGGHSGDVTAKAQFHSSNPQVATVNREGIVRAAGDGEALITARLGARHATAKIIVQNAQRSFTWSFRNHVLPVMTKAGCNSGACHGAAAGKNGFKLTLRGYDPEADYLTLTRQAIGRRIVKQEPAQSLMLLKPTMTIAHGGGQRFRPGSLEYQIISDWIASGTPPPTEHDPLMQRLEVIPPGVVLRPGADQQVLVRAHFSDGHTEDVTRWAKYNSADVGVATVNDDGLVKMVGHGEAAITVWYLNKVAYARLAVPFPNRIDPRVYRTAKRNNFIDDLVLKKLEELRIAPSEPATDNEFVRRAYLDAAGILPTPAEVERFISEKGADQRPDRRARLIEEILGRSEYLDYWAYKWSDLLLVNTAKLAPPAVRSYYNWVRESVEKNKPWDKMAREILTGSGSTLENGALNFFVLHKETIDLSETVTQAFLGMRITCARCHNHPLEKWTQRDYYQFANLFSRVSLKNGSERGEFIVYAAADGNINHPRLNRPLPPRPLEGQEVPLADGRDRRQVLADWLTSPRNPYFARAMVNRVWRNFMGRGLVEAVDDVRETNPASNEALFQRLTQEFVAHGFDVKWLVRAIMNSATYQLSSKPNATNEKDEKYYSHYIIRRLPAEVILDATAQVTGVPTTFDGYPRGTRALQLPETRVNSYFLTVFGRPPRVFTSEEERHHEPSVTQALHVINGQTLNEKLRAPNGVADMLARLGFSAERIVEHMYLAALSRPPTPKERQSIAARLDEAEAQGAKTKGLEDAVVLRRQAIEDLMWAMLSGKEFLFNH